MKKFFKILLYILAGIVVYCVVSFFAGLIKGYCDACKIKEEMSKIREKVMAEKTFFGLTLDEKISVPEERLLIHDDFIMKNFDIRALANESTMRYDIVALDRKFYGADKVIALSSAHDKKVRAIAACMCWDNESSGRSINGFGSADETCDKIRCVLEEKYHCKMNVLDREPSFVKKFVISPDASGVFISRKSCFMASPNFCATIFVLGYRRAQSGEFVWSWERNRDYLILFINTPNLNDISKREQELDARDWELKKREESERERKAAFDAL